MDKRKLLRRGVSVLLLAFGLCGLSIREACGNDQGSILARRAPSYAGDLFPSYWAPAAPGVISAPLYVSPIPTPPHVGHVWITYQPLYPHEFLYKHSKVYWRNNPQGGRTRVVVSWY